MAGTGMHPYPQQWPPAPPPSQPVLMENPGQQTNTEEIRTIFITGLPQDVKERELQNLLRFLPGYETSQMNLKGDQPMGFALFSTSHQAIGAKDTLQDLVFDADLKAVLHTEMAKKNLFVKRGVVSDSSSFDQSKRLRTGGDYNHTGYPSASPFHPPIAPVWGPQGYMAPPPPYDPYGAYPPPPVHIPPAGPPVHMPPPSSVPIHTSYAPVQNAKDNPPCNTLFVGNLGENVVEEELRGIFSVQPGYKQMKILRQERNTVCFIEFEDVNSATAVHQSLQGAVLSTSGRSGMRIQYSRNPFGRRKDTSNGVAADNAASTTY